MEPGKNGGQQRANGAGVGRAGKRGSRQGCGIRDAMGPGFRVPLPVASLYAKRGHASHHFDEESGFIAFIENNFDLGIPDARDAGTDAFLDCFDYKQAPSPLAPSATKVSVDRLVGEQDSGPPDDDSPAGGGRGRGHRTFTLRTGAIVLILLPKGSSKE